MEYLHFGKLNHEFGNFLVPSLLKATGVNVEAIIHANQAIDVGNLAEVDSCAEKQHSSKTWKCCEGETSRRVPLRWRLRIGMGIAGDWWGNCARTVGVRT